MNLSEKTQDCIKPVFCPEKSKWKAERDYEEYIIGTDDEQFLMSHSTCFTTNSNQLQSRQKEGSRNDQERLDNYYNFSISNGEENSVLYMGKVFAVLTKKDSISSKYRGHELKK